MHGKYFKHRLEAVLISPQLKYASRKSLLFESWQIRVGASSPGFYWAWPKSAQWMRYFDIDTFRSCLTKYWEGATPNLEKDCEIRLTAQYSAITTKSTTRNACMSVKAWALFVILSARTHPNPSESHILYLLQQQKIKFLLAGKVCVKGSRENTSWAIVTKMLLIFNNKLVNAMFIYLITTF